MAKSVVDIVKSFLAPPVVGTPGTRKRSFSPRQGGDGGYSVVAPRFGV